MSPRLALPLALTLSFASVPAMAAKGYSQSVAQQTAVRKAAVREWKAFVRKTPGMRKQYIAAMASGTTVVSLMSLPAGLVGWMAGGLAASPSRFELGQDHLIPWQAGAAIGTAVGFGAMAAVRMPQVFKLARTFITEQAVAEKKLEPHIAKGWEHAGLISDDWR